MSGTTTRRMLALYVQMAQPMLFLSGLFKSPAENFHNTEEVEIDIVRSDEDVSIVIQDLSVGYRMNSEDIYTNKSFKPPIHKEAIPLNSHDLIKRMPGQNPFQNPDFRINIIERMFRGMTKVERKIRRSVELQASQVLQNGVTTLIDSNGVALYTLDYKPKVTHFPTAGTAWDAAEADILGDLGALANVVRNDGLTTPDTLIMGEDAFEVSMKDTDFIARFNTRRIDLGTIAPMVTRGDGGNYRGVVEIGNYRFDIWTYGARYKHPQTGTKTQFVTPANVIMLSSGARLDATFGSIPNIGQLLNAANTNLIPELPARLSNAAGGMDLFTNVWLSDNGENLFGGVGARPLMIPTAIDTFGCIRTGV